jgi:DNA-binding XRE family transcriptional regulator
MTTRITQSRTSFVPPTQAGKEIRAIRRRLGRTQRAFAGLLATHRDTLSAWERGVYEPPLMALTLARYLLLALPPRRAFIPATTDPETPPIHLSPGCECYWHHNDPAPCGGRQFHVEVQLSRRRHLVSEVCMVHLGEAFEAVFKKLEAAAQAEQRRQAGIRRKRLARQRAREAAAAPPGA